MDWIWAAHLDRRVYLTSGSETSNMTVWTLPFTDDTLDTVILGPDFGSNEGKVLPAFSTNGLVMAVGLYGTGCVIAGRAYTMRLELSPVFMRANNGNAMIGGRLHLGRVTAEHRNTGEYTIRSVQTNRDDKQDWFDAGSNNVEEGGRLTTWVQGNARDVQTFIENETPKPSAIASVEYDAEYSPWGPR